MRTDIASTALIFKKKVGNHQADTVKPRLTTTPKMRPPRYYGHFLKDPIFLLYISMVGTPDITGTPLFRNATT